MSFLSVDVLMSVNVKLKAEKRINVLLLYVMSDLINRMQLILSCNFHRSVNNLPWHLSFGLEAIFATDPEAQIDRQVRN